MQIVRGPPNFHFRINEPAQSGGKRGQLGREHFRIADQGPVRLQFIFVLGHVSLNVLAAHFLFTLDQELHVDGQFAFALEKALRRFHQKVGLSFVVHSAARVNILVAHGGFKGGRFPFVERVRGLDIVMSINEKRRLPLRSEPFGVNERVLFRGAVNDFHSVHAHFAQVVGDEFGGAPDVSLMFGQRGDARNS